MKNLAPEIVFGNENFSISPTPGTEEQILIKIPGAIVHLLENDKSVQLSDGDFSIVSLRQRNNTIAVFARVGEEIQWPLTKEEPAVKVDDFYYQFTLRIPKEEGKGGEVEFLNLGLSIATKEEKLDSVLETYGCLIVEEVNKDQNSSYYWVMEKINEVEENFESNSTNLASNVEEYTGSLARLITSGSGQIIRWILWCGVVTVDKLKWGYQFLSKRIGAGKNLDVSANTLKIIRWVKRLTKTLEIGAAESLSGVVKVSGFFTSLIVNFTGGHFFFRLLPGEIVVAFLDEFNKIHDTIEVTGKNVMLTTSIVTTGLVSQRYGEQAGKVTNDLLDAVGYVFATAWSLFNITKALNPNSVFKAALAKASAEKQKAK